MQNVFGIFKIFVLNIQTCAVKMKEDVYVSKYLRMDLPAEKRVPKNPEAYDPKCVSRKRDLNPWLSFNNENYDTSNEQNVLKRLQEEQIQMFGYRGLYILKGHNTVDELFGESIGATYSWSFPIEFFPEDGDGPENSWSIEMYGYSQLDSIVIHIAKDRLDEEIARLGDKDRTCPLPGDLLRYNLTSQLYEIKWVSDRLHKFMKGCKTMYRLEMQLFNLGQETFDTDNEEVDFLNEFNRAYQYPNADNEPIRKESAELAQKEPNIWNLDLQKPVEYDADPEPRHSEDISRLQPEKPRRGRKWHWEQPR